VRDVEHDLRLSLIFSKVNDFDLKAPSRAKKRTIMGKDLTPLLGAFSDSLPKTRQIIKVRGEVARTIHFHLFRRRDWLLLGNYKVYLHPSTANNARPFGARGHEQ